MHAPACLLLVNNESENEYFPIYVTEIIYYIT